jgi:hypothetical protein
MRLDHRQFYCVSDDSMGRSFPWRYRKRQYQMASPYLGYVGGSAYSVGSYQLFAAKDVFRYFQVWDCHDDAGFCPLHCLAPDWRLEDIWFSLCQRCLHCDQYVPAELTFFVRFYIILFQTMELAHRLGGIGSYASLCLKSFIFDGALNRIAQSIHWHLSGWF